MQLGDRHGRVATDLRVSLTDRCNLRCTYCMPADGLPWLPTDEALTDAEVVRLLTVAVERLGITKLRFTGGEPLLRPGLAGIIAASTALPTADGRPPETSLTTNGLGLDKRLDDLVAAGLDRVNISLDSLDRATYARLSRRDRLPDVVASIEAVMASPLRPIKINAVIMRGENEQAIAPLAQFCLERGLQLRFIEQMPLGPRHEWVRSAMVTQAEILEVLHQHHALTPVDEPRGHAPAELWRVEPDTRPGTAHSGGTIGVIASVTHPFCAACDRSRITADGQVRTCLFSRTETDLRTILRSGGSDDDLAAAWVGAHASKPAGHGIDEPTFLPPLRTMSAIGG
jgi:GTP 3',8-cyclase